jgi:hypothetical protein
MGIFPYLGIWKYEGHVTLTYLQITTLKPVLGSLKQKAILRHEVFYD